MHRITQLIALSCILALGTAAHAQSINLDTEADIRVDAGSALNASSSAGPATDTGSAADADEDRATVIGSASFDLSRIDASVANSSGAVVDAASVNTESDLEAYAAATLRASDSFKSVRVDSDAVMLRFDEEARLLGFIPHTMTSRIEVKGDGSVRVMRPWYGFLATGASATASADIEARVRQALAQVDTDDGSGLSVRAQAAILAEVAASLNNPIASAENDVSVDAGSDTDVVTPAQP